MLSFKGYYSTSQAKYVQNIKYFQIKQFTILNLKISVSNMRYYRENILLQIF